MPRLELHAQLLDKEIGGKSMKKNIKIGIIGLGQRGGIMLENPIIPMMKNGAGIEIAAVCDLLPDRVTAAA